MAEQVFLPSAGAASGRITPASFPFYTTGEDNLRITSFNEAIGVKLKLNGRLLNAAGRPAPDSWDHTPNTDRSAKSSDLPLSGATLLNLTVFAVSGAPLVGQTFVKVELIRGLGTSAIVLGTLIQGYVTAAQGLGFPGSPIQKSTDVLPPPRSFPISPLNSGVDFQGTVPTGARWEIVALFCQFTADATPGNRTIFLRFSDPLVSTFALVPFPSNPGPASTTFFTFARNLTKDVSLGFIQSAPLLDEIALTSGQSIASSTSGMGANDAWLPVNLTVREYLEVN